MKYLIFANNNKFCYHNILLNFLNITDTIITLNHCLPLDAILSSFNHYNIYHFSRRSFNKTIPYSGLHIIDKNKSKFKKIFLYPHPESIHNKSQKQKTFNYIINKTSFNISDFSHMSDFGKNPITKEARQFLSECYNKSVNLSMGLIAYLYIKQIKEDNDQIFLIGFTHSMNNNKHNAMGERDYFAHEKEKGICQII